MADNNTGLVVVGGIAAIVAGIFLLKKKKVEGGPGPGPGQVTMTGTFSIN